MDYIKTNLIDIGDTSVHEFVTENEDGGHSIFINARLSHEAQLLAYDHAMRHIRNDDFRKEDVQRIEAEAHNVHVAGEDAR